MVIDVHTHIFESSGAFPKGFIDGMYEFKRRDLGEEKFEVWVQHFENARVENLIKEMDEVGIDKSVVLPVDFGIQMREEPKISIWRANEYIAEAQERYPDRIIGFAGVDPLRRDAIDLLEKGVKKWGLKGVKLMASTFSVGDAEVQPFMFKVNELGVPLLIHTGTDPIPYHVELGNPAQLDTLLLRYPKIRIIAAHAAKGYEELMTGMIKVREGRLYADIAGWQYEYQRSHWHFLLKMRYLMDRIPGAIMMGSDWPFIKTSPYITHKEWFDGLRNLKMPEGVVQLGLGIRDFSEEQKNMILGENARSMLGI